MTKNRSAGTAAAGLLAALAAASVIWGSIYLAIAYAIETLLPS